MSDDDVRGREWGYSGCVRIGLQIQKRLLTYCGICLVGCVV